MNLIRILAILFVLIVLLIWAIPKFHPNYSSRSPLYPETAQERAGREFFSDVKNVNIILCYNSVPTHFAIPDTLQPDKMIRVASESLKAHEYNQIQFRDGKVHDPVVIAKSCGVTYEPGLGISSDENNLNFLINVYFFKERKDVHVAVISKIIFRTRHDINLPSLLIQTSRYQPDLINLDDSKKAEKELEEAFNKGWLIFR